MKKVLVCDDDESILDMMYFLLSSHGFEVVVEQQSHKIYDQINNFQPDILILDLWMPNLRGDQIIEYLDQNPLIGRKIPVLLYSASQDPSFVSRSLGADEYLSKPFDMNDLVQKVNHLVAA